MNFQEEHLLTYGGFMQYTKKNYSPYNKALIISKHLKNYCFFYKNKLHYCFDGSDEFEETDIHEERYLLTLISAYLAFSIEALCDDEIGVLNMTPCFQTICENENILKYLPQLMVLLKNDDVIEKEEVVVESVKEKEEIKEVEKVYKCLDDGEEYCVNEESENLTPEQVALLLFS